MLVGIAVEHSVRLESYLGEVLPVGFRQTIEHFTHIQEQARTTVVCLTDTMPRDEPSLLMVGMKVQRLVRHYQCAAFRSNRNGCSKDYRTKTSDETLEGRTIHTFQMAVSVLHQLIKHEHLKEGMNATKVSRDELRSLRSALQVLRVSD